MVSEPISTRALDRLIDVPICGSVRWALARLALADTPMIEALNRLAAESDVRSASGVPLRFVTPLPASKLFEEQYEVRVFQRGEVATRSDNWHDFFNALVWLTYPQTKAKLNALHYRELERNFGASLRGTARDVLTLFDEGGAIVVTTDPSIRDDLRSHRWKDLFWHRRAALNESTRFFVFGHAILERALAPIAGATAKALVLDVDPSFMSMPEDAARAMIDARSAAYFATPEALSTTRALGPLPILGIPGWTPENGAAHYYDDTRYFRPLSLPRSGATSA